MSAASTLAGGVRRARGETSRISRLVRWTCVLVTVLFVGTFLILPLASVFYEATKPLTAPELRRAVRDSMPETPSGQYWVALTNKNSVNAMWMTVKVCALAVPLNVIFGVMSAWAIAKFDFRWKAILTTIIDIPFAVSPVISGLVFVLLFGPHGLVGPWLLAHGVQIIYAYPGMVLATVFVTFPFVARELIPLMEEQGTAEEQAAISLGASAWQTFWRVTLPNIKWGLLYGVLLCNARAMGEFGAVAVVAQQMQGESSTLPLEIETLYLALGGIRKAFALASVLAMLGLITLAAKAFLEWKIRKDQREALEVVE